MNWPAGRTTIEAIAPAGDSAPGFVAAGDALARAGRWPEAIEAWTSALSAEGDQRAGGRIHWFLREMQPESRDVNGERRSLLIPVGVGVAAGIIGTLCVLVAETVDTPTSQFLAIAAWIAFLVAATAGLLYAHQRGHRHAPAITVQSIDHARELARTLAPGSATIAAGPWHPF